MFINYQALMNQIAFPQSDYVVFTSSFAPTKNKNFFVKLCFSHDFFDFLILDVLFNQRSSSAKWNSIVNFSRVIRNYPLIKLPKLGHILMKVSMIKIIEIQKSQVLKFALSN